MEVGAWMGTGPGLWDAFSQRQTGMGGGAILGRTGCWPEMITRKYGGFRKLEPAKGKEEWPFTLSCLC